jgi:hypothetical protein
MSATTYKQPWLYQSKIEFIFILLPPVLPLIGIVLFHDYFANNSEVNTMWWIILVLFVDVAHVYSTIFRMYWDKNIYQKHKALLWIIPLVGLIIGCMLHLIDALVFWRVLAYLAVFHFIRQQYGFMRLYSRREAFDTWQRKLDTISIYNATLYPILYWHLNLTSKLSWFVQGDFIALNVPILSKVLTIIYWCILGISIVKEVFVFRQTSVLNIPKILILTGTYLSWYLGIVIFQGDLVFTMLNVVAHGIPYMALVWIFGEKNADKKVFKFNYRGVLIFLCTICLLAYFEEALWDIFVWKDHVSVFPIFTNVPIIENPFVLSLLVPLLTLPQITHYVLDGFIWKIGKPSHQL